MGRTAHSAAESVWTGRVRPMTAREVSPRRLNSFLPAVGAVGRAWQPVAEHTGLLADVLQAGRAVEGGFQGPPKVDAGH